MRIDLYAPRIANDEQYGIGSPSTPPAISKLTHDREDTNGMVRLYLDDAKIWTGDIQKCYEIIRAVSAMRKIGQPGQYATVRPDGFIEVWSGETSIGVV